MKKSTGLTQFKTEEVNWKRGRKKCNAKKFVEINLGEKRVWMCLELVEEIRIETTK